MYVCVNSRTFQGLLKYLIRITSSTTLQKNTDLQNINLLSTVLRAKSDSDVIFCLQMLS